jgi:hypothetical protein
MDGRVPRTLKIGFRKTPPYNFPDEHGNATGPARRPYVDEVLRIQHDIETVFGTRHQAHVCGRIPTARVEMSSQLNSVQFDCLQSAVGAFFVKLTEAGADVG